MVERVLMKKITGCEGCSYYETVEHEDYGKYYTVCTLFDVEIVSKEGYQPKALFGICELPTSEKGVLKLSEDLTSDLVGVIHKYANERSELAIRHFFLWLKLHCDSQKVFKLSDDEVFNDYKRWSNLRRCD